MREWIYGPGRGAPVGNESAYLARYRRHNAEVVAHFAGREERLLVLDVTAGDGWEALCGFLSLPVPVPPFPHVNRAVQGGEVMAEQR